MNWKIKLIYTSTPWRGLNVLLKAFEIIDRDDIELHIYSSTKIYGDDFDKQTNERYKPLFDKAQSMENVIYHGYGTNDEVRQAVSESHIFAYPCIFEETSCISAIEAGMAGCRIITTNFGALPETCSEFAKYVPFNSDLQELAIDYAYYLNQEIDNIRSIETQSLLEDQKKFFNRFYSWESRIPEWEFLLKIFK